MVAFSFPLFFQLSVSFPGLGVSLFRLFGPVCLELLYIMHFLRRSLGARNRI